MDLYAILGILTLLVGGTGWLAWTSSRGAQRRRNETPGINLNMESQGLLRPLRHLSNEIEELVEKFKDSSTVQLMGTEAKSEARRLLEQAAKSLEHRTELRTALRGKYEASVALDRLRASGGEELAGAIAAREAELAHYDEVEAAILQIENRLKLAEANLSELKTRLAIGGPQERAAAMGTNDELRDALARMKSLNAAYDEVESLGQGR
jgi:hypothetical protein